MNMTPPRWLVYASIAVLLGAAVGAPFVLNGYWLFLFAQAAVQAIAVLSAVVLFRVSGALTLCQASFTGVGAYLAAWLSTGPGLPLWASCLVAPLIAAPVGLLVALPALRLRSIQLSILTVTVALMLGGLVFSSSAPFKVGNSGGAKLAAGRILGLRLSEPKAAYAFGVIIASLCFGAVALIFRSSLGTTWRALNSSRAAAASVGISVTRHTMVGFALSAMLAAISGVMLISIYTTVDVTSFNVFSSIQLVIVASLFGMNLRAGALGGLVVGVLQQIPKQFGLQNDYVTAALGLLLVVAVFRSRLEVTDG
jgi:branched-chain amino acid transport system permease protein